MNKLRICLGGCPKNTAYNVVTEKLVWNKCSYQVPVRVVINASTKKHRFYNSTVQEISRGGGNCAAKV